MNVVCINDEWRGDYLVMNPVKNEIYTVVAVRENPIIGNELIEGIFYRLAGLNGLYNSENFRPVDNSFGEDVCARIVRELVTVNV